LEALSPGNFHWKRYEAKLGYSLSGWLWSFDEQSGPSPQGERQTSAGSVLHHRPVELPLTMKTRISTPGQWNCSPYRLAKVAFQRLSLVSALCCLAWPASGTIVQRFWNGSVNGYWSEPRNWNPPSVPRQGESYNFRQESRSTNDLVGLVVNALVFEHRVAIYGNPIILSNVFHRIDYPDAISGEYDSMVEIHCGLQLATDARLTIGDFYEHSYDSELHLKGFIDLNGHELLLVPIWGGWDYKRSIYVSGAISGAGNVTAGTLNGTYVEFNGSGNSFQGSLNLFAGVNSTILLNGSSGVVATHEVRVRRGSGSGNQLSGLVRLGRSNQIGDNAKVTIENGARLSLNGYNDTIGDLALLNDTLDSFSSTLDTGSGTLTLRGQLNSSNFNAFVTPTVKGNLYLPGGSHIFDISGTVYEGLDLQAQISGGGGFSKFGDAALLLQGNNSFEGGVSVVSGTIEVYHANGFGSTVRGVTLNGGSVTLRNLSVNGETLFVRGTGQITPETAGSLLTSFGVSAWTGAIELDTNLVVGFGDMILSGSISGPGGLALHSKGTVQIGGSDHNTYTGTTLVRCPLLELNKPYEVRAYAGPLVVGGGTGGPFEARWLNHYQNRGGALTVFENGLVTLTNVTEQFDVVTFNGGRVETGVSGLMSIGDPFTTNGSTVTVNPANTPAVINGFLQPYGGPAVFYVADGAREPDLLINASIVGISPYLIKQGPGTMKLTGANSYIGVTKVNEGVLVAGQDSALGDPSFGTIVAANATLRIEGIDNMSERIELNGNGVDSTVGALDVAGGGTMTSPIVLGSASTIHTVGSLAINSVISGTGPLIKTGSGNLFLGGVSGGTGNNSYTGDTIVRAGTLYLSKNQNTLSVPGPLVVGPATAASPAVARFSRSGTMTNAGTVAVNANSQLDLNGNNQLLSLLNLNDGGDVQTGAGTLSFIAGGSVNVGTLNPGLSGLRASASISGRIAAADNDYLVFNVGGYGLVPLTSDPEVVVSAEIAGRLSSIAKNGEGTMLLSGNNTFAGSSSTVTELNINSGAVIAASPTALGGADNWVYVINGASLALVENITINNKPLYLNSTNPAALDNRGGSNTWNGPISLSRDSGISVNQDWSLQILGLMSGTGSLTKIGAGVLRLGGSTHNTFAGDTFVNEGTLELAKGPYLHTVPANLVIGLPGGGNAARALFQSDHQIRLHITVNRGGLLDLNGFSEFGDDLTLNGGGDVQTGTGVLYLSNLAVNPGRFADQSVISGRLGLYPGAHFFAVGAGFPSPGNADCLVSANIFQYTTSAGLAKTGAGFLRLTGENTHTGVTYLGGGTLQIDGVQPQSPVELEHETRLQGIGTVGHIVLKGEATAIAPGSSPGTLTCGNFDASGGSGTLEIELNSFPTGYDQIIARGTVDLRGLTLKASLHSAAAVRQQFTIINNEGGNAVTGTFTGLPQNAPLTIGNKPFAISYTGGTGNDVVLTPPTLSDLSQSLQNATGSFQFNGANANGESYTVVGGGNDIWDNHDQFTFCYTELCGDFDVKVRVDSLTANAPFSKAGLMVRESLAEDSRMLFERVTPPPVPTCAEAANGANNVRFSYRTGRHINDANGNGDRFNDDTNDGRHEDGTGSPAYPNAWIRLVRQGQLISGYHGTDGVNWTLSAFQHTGSGNWINPPDLLPFPSKVLLGLAVSRQSGPRPDCATATAQFRDLTLERETGFCLRAVDSQECPRHIRLCFTHPLGPEAYDFRNYVVGDVAVNDVRPGPTPYTVDLHLEADLVEGMTYGVVANTIHDASGMLIGPFCNSAAFVHASESPAQKVHVLYNQAPANWVPDYQSGLVGYYFQTLAYQLGLPVGTGGKPAHHVNDLYFEDGPTAIADNDFHETFVTRIIGVLQINVDGNYRFACSSDDGGALFLSPDDQSARKREIAREPRWAGTREWTGSAPTAGGRAGCVGNFCENVSAPIYLVAGGKYYLEYVAAEGGGGNHAAVTWDAGTGSFPTNGATGLATDPNDPIWQGKGQLIPSRWRNNQIFYNLGEAALSIIHDTPGNTVVLSWRPGCCRLQSADDLKTPPAQTQWQDVAGTSPLVLSANAPRRFYRTVYP
jgi:autotransporter-associated beta strand protein